MLIQNDAAFFNLKKNENIKKTFFPVKDVCKNVKCGHGSCTVTSTPPFYECKCKAPYRPPDCKKGGCFPSLSSPPSCPPQPPHGFIHSLLHFACSLSLQAQPLSKWRDLHEGPQTLQLPVLLPWRVQRDLLRSR